MTQDRLELGRLGEKLALKKVKKIGYKKIEQNYRCPLGEIDLIARDGDTLVFIEIKTRKGKSIGYAKEAVDQRKKRKISQVALYYMKSNDCCDAKSRFDVVAVCIDGKDREVEVIRDAFEYTAT